MRKISQTQAITIIMESPQKELSKSCEGFLNLMKKKERNGRFLLKKKSENVLVKTKAFLNMLTF